MRARTLTLIVGLTLAPAALAYGAGTGTATPAARAPQGAHAARTAMKLTKAQKLKKTLAACKREKTEPKRKSCEAKAKRLYGAHSKKAIKPAETTAGEHAAEPKQPAGGGATTGGGAAGAMGGATTGVGGATGGNEAEELQQAATVGAPTPAGVEAGKKLFAEQCAGCHGTTGMGGDGGPNLNVLPRAHSVTGVIEQLIKPEGPMPDFDKVLSFQQKEELANFVTVEITHVAQG
jgi:mono/diheme cytochrome c family protein